MDRSLAAREASSLGVPLRAQPLRFRCLADRAVSLLAVLAVVGMTLRAMDPSAIQRGGTARLAQGVVFGGGESEVAHVHARAITAGVMYDASVWDGSEGVEVCDAVSAAALSAELKVPVPVLVAVSRPHEAVALL